MKLSLVQSPLGQGKTVLVRRGPSRSIREHPWPSEDGFGQLVVSPGQLWVNRRSVLVNLGQSIENPPMSIGGNP